VVEHFQREQAVSLNLTTATPHTTQTLQ
jgi:hypothetical protein